MTIGEGMCAILFSVPIDVMARMKAIKSRTGVTLNNLCRLAMAQYLEREEQKIKKDAEAN